MYSVVALESDLLNFLRLAVLIHLPFLSISAMIHSQIDTQKLACLTIEAGGDQNLTCHKYAYQF